MCITVVYSLPVYHMVRVNVSNVLPVYPGVRVNVRYSFPVYPGVRVKVSIVEEGVMPRREPPCLPVLLTWDHAGKRASLPSGYYSVSLLVDVLGSLVRHCFL